MTTEEEWREQEMRKQVELEGALMHFLKEDRTAVAFILDLLFILHLWDDMHDGDRPRSVGEIDQAFWTALVGITRNVFFVRHQMSITTLLQQVILSWHAANELEAEWGDRGLNLAYGLRAAVHDIIHYSAFLVGGADWAINVGPEIRLLYQEDLEKWKKEQKGEPDA